MNLPIPLPLILLLGGFFLSLVVILLVSVSRYGKYLTKAPARLGAHMELTKLQARKGFSQGDFYGGNLNGRAFALTYVTLKTSSTDADGSSSANAHPTLRLILEVKVPEPRSIDIHRRHIEGQRFGSFAEAFGSKRQAAEQLSQNAQAALLRFAAKYGPLRLKDRPTYHQRLLPPPVLSDAHWVLVHDALLTHRELKIGQSPDEVWALLAEMAQLAETLEAEWVT